MDELKNTNEFIEIKGARVHNLKNINLKIPRNKLVVITGLSGSGKSSLAFNTLYAEGQRRFVESLSAYARQFLGRMNKPDVDLISGIPPAIAIEQKVNTRNPRSTVGTTTEIYDYLKLLFARVGKTYSPVTGKEVKHHSISDVVDYILSFPDNTKILLLVSLNINDGNDLRPFLENMLKRGETRIETNGEVLKIKDVLEQNKLDFKKNDTYLLIDRAIVNHNDEFSGRIADSVQRAFYEGNGRCKVKVLLEDKTIEENFSNKYEADGIKFEEPNIYMFSFNSPSGACKRCEGYGMVIGIDENLVVPDKSLSVYNDAIVCWKGEKMQAWKERLILNAEKFNFPIHKPYEELTAEQKQLLWTGNLYFKGINDFFRMLEEGSYKIQYRVLLSRFRGKTICPDCNGARLKKEAFYVKINDKNIGDIVNMPISELAFFFRNLKLNNHEYNIAKRLLVEINNRLDFLINVGLGYLTLNRVSSTLSGGESQRINLAKSLGSSLVGSLYILDEPSIGLHPRDTNKLINVLKQLRDIGNTVIVVEHDEEIINSSDEIIDIGPGAGINGGEIVFQGKHENLISANESITAKFLSGIENIEIPIKRRKWQNYISVEGASENNLKNLSVKFPLNIMTVVTGVSGSGKSTLVRDILFNSLNNYFNKSSEKPGKLRKISGDLHLIKNVEFIDQNPIGKSSRSNPVTYIKAYDDIRKLYSEQPLSKLYNLKPSHFSFNVDGGRCEECQGEGTITVEMQFMADIELVCESCGGKRFKDDILEVKYQDKSIYDLLETSVEEAIELFSKSKIHAEQKIAEKLKPLADVGLGYIKLGQSSSTLSGGESQRVKLASFLGKDKTQQPTLFIFDEPTTGLHFYDIKKLLNSLNALIQHGHTVIIIEHNLEVIKCADWIIDLGPEGGEQGGYVVFEGTPEQIISHNNSYTGNYLKNKFH